MESDPHDQLLLARRPTTVVRQHTKMFDRMDAPFGSQEDEEGLFAGVSGDDAASALAQKLSINKDQLIASLPGLKASQPAGAGVVAAPSTSGTKKGLMIAAAIGAAWFLFFRR